MTNKMRVFTNKMAVLPNKMRVLPGLYEEHGDSLGDGDPGPGQQGQRVSLRRARTQHGPGASSLGEWTDLDHQRL